MPEPFGIHAAWSVLCLQAVVKAKVRPEPACHPVIVNLFLQLGRSTLQEATEAMNTISMPGQSASQPPGASPSPQGTLALPAPPPLAATQYLQIVGMVTAEVLTDNEEYSEVSYNSSRTLAPFHAACNYLSPTKRHTERLAPARFQSCIAHKTSEKASWIRCAQM